MNNHCPTTLKKLGLTKAQMATVKCQCGSKNLSTAYFIEANEYQITCLDCQRDGSGTTYLAAAHNLAIFNNGQSADYKDTLIDSL